MRSAPSRAKTYRERLNRVIKRRSRRGAQAIRTRLQQMLLEAEGVEFSVDGRVALKNVPVVPRNPKTSAREGALYKLSPALRAGIRVVR